jgi:hypothetical protein
MSNDESAFMKKMMDAFAVGQPAPNTSSTEIAELRRLVEDLKAQIATVKPTSPLTERRV